MDGLGPGGWQGIGEDVKEPVVSVPKPGRANREGRGVFSSTKPSTAAVDAVGGLVPEQESRLVEPDNAVEAQE
eukprot:9875271-Heterocapsa_arctica.AAC.1